MEKNVKKKNEKIGLFKEKLFKHLQAKLFSLSLIKITEYLLNIHFTLLSKIRFEEMTLRSPVFSLFMTNHFLLKITMKSQP